MSAGCNSARRKPTISAQRSFSTTRPLGTCHSQVPALVPRMMSARRRRRRRPGCGSLKQDQREDGDQRNGGRQQQELPAIAPPDVASRERGRGLERGQPQLPQQDLDARIVGRDGEPAHRTALRTQPQQRRRHLARQPLVHGGERDEGPLRVEPGGQREGEERRRLLVDHPHPRRSSRPPAPSARSPQFARSPRRPCRRGPRGPRGRAACRWCAPSRAAAGGSPPWPARAPAPGSPRGSCARRWRAGVREVREIPQVVAVGADDDHAAERRELDPVALLDQRGERPRHRVALADLDVVGGVGHHEVESIPADPLVELGVAQRLEPQLVRGQGLVERLDELGRQVASVSALAEGQDADRQRSRRADRLGASGRPQGRRQGDERRGGRARDTSAGQQERRENRRSPQAPRQTTSSGNSSGATRPARSAGRGSRPPPTITEDSMRAVASRSGSLPVSSLWLACSSGSSSPR